MLWQWRDDVDDRQLSLLSLFGCWSLVVMEISISWIRLHWKSFSRDGIIDIKFYGNLKDREATLEAEAVYSACICKGWLCLLA